MTKLGEWLGQIPARILDVLSYSEFFDKEQECFICSGELESLLDHQDPGESLLYTVAEITIVGEGCFQVLGEGPRPCCPGCLDEAIEEAKKPRSVKAIENLTGAIELESAQ